MTAALLVALQTLVTCAQTDKPGSSGPPPSIAGIWDARQVAVDRQDQLHWRFRPDEPSILWRSLVIDADKVHFDFAKELSCKQTVWRAMPTTWGVLFGKGFPRPPVGGRSRTPSPGDFAVKVEKKTPVTAYPVCPESGKGASRFPGAPWVALQAPDTLTLNLDNQVLVIFERRAPDAKPTASFECAKAATPTEKAICASFDLASWDRSVAAAFRQAVQRSPERKDELRQGQREWLKTRDACGSAATCIDDLLWRRVDELTQEE